ncbi:MAG: hypothetical protein JWQ27_694 [Ferruginibacter sp.]|nr:hypothetical protein [Ferruginibacter sp.]
MNNNLKDILSHLNQDVDQEKLIDYLNKNLPHDEEHAVERSMMEDEFMNDAMEGLQQLDAKKDIGLLVHQLNADLKKQLEIKKQRKQKRALPGQDWVYYTIVLLLILVVIAYVVIKKLGI